MKALFYFFPKKNGKIIKRAVHSQNSPNFVHV